MRGSQDEGAQAAELDAGGRRRFCCALWDFCLARAPLFRETTVIVDAGGCRMVTDVVDRRRG